MVVSLQESVVSSPCLSIGEAGLQLIEIFASCFMFHDLFYMVLVNVYKLVL